MIELDQTRTARPPTAWSAELVRQRLVEAFSIYRRMPGQRYGNGVSTTAWPATPLHEFTDVLHWTDARERVWESWARSHGVYSWEVTRMEEAFDWLPWLPEGERRCLSAWAVLSAHGRSSKSSITSMCNKRRWSRATFYRQCDKAASHIAERLNAKKVQVR